MYKGPGVEIQAHSRKGKETKVAELLLGRVRKGRG